MDVAGDPEHQRPGHHAAIKHKDKRDPKHWKGFKFAVPFEYSMHNFLLRYYVAEHGLDPGHRHPDPRQCRRPRWWPTCAPATSTASSAPIPFNQRAVYDEVGFIHVLSKEIWDGHPCCAFARQQGIHQAEPQHLRRAVTGDPRRHAPWRAKAEEPQADRQGDRAAELPEPARDGARAGADRHLRRRPGQREERIPTAPTSIPFPWQQLAVWILTQMKRWG